MANSFQDLKNILDDENRRDFQSKKHVSLDVKHTRFLENILKASSSSEEEETTNFEEQRRQFQARKHKSLDPKVTFKLDKDKEGGATSDDEFVRPERRSLIRAKRHDSNSIIIDLKDFQNILQEAQEEVDKEVLDDDEEDDEDFAEARKSFQAQRSKSTDSRRSFRFFEMDELGGGKKGENFRNSIPFVRQITEDGKPMLEIYRPTTNPIYIYTQVSNRDKSCLLIHPSVAINLCIVASGYIYSLSHYHWGLRSFGRLGNREYEGTAGHQWMNSNNN